VAKFFIEDMTSDGLQMVKRAVPSVTAPHCNSLLQPQVPDLRGEPLGTRGARIIWGESGIEVWIRRLNTSGMLGREE